MNNTLKIVLALTICSVAAGCATQAARAPGIAVGDGPVIYMTHVDRIPREAIGKGVTVKGEAPVGTEAIAGELIEVVGGVVTKITPELMDAYKEVERNTAARSVEVYITGYTNLIGENVEGIVDTFNEIVGQPFPTK